MATLRTIPFEILVTTFLEMTDPSQAEPHFAFRNDVQIQRMQVADVEYYRYLYRAVGEQWRWRDRLEISHEEMCAILESEQTSVYVLHFGGAPAGYIELCDEGGDVEIAYFGLREAYHGRGLGKYLLRFGIHQAWQGGARRIWLHTCNLDGPHALANYQKRGFRIFRTETEPMPAIYA